MKFSELSSVKNVPEYADKYEFMVVRKVDDDLWFYGAYSDGAKADRIAKEIDGIVIHNVRIQGVKK